MREDVLAKRMGRLGSETSFEILARAKKLEAQGRHIIHLEIGEPDFDTPQNIKAAAVRALDAGYTHYTPSAGLPEVREAIADFIRRDRGVDVSPQQVVVTPGAKPLIFLTMLALIEPGDEVVYPNPGFPIYESMIHFLEGKAVPLPLEESRGFTIDLDKFDSLVSPRTKLCVLNSPQNPTGGVLSRETLEGMAEIARKNDVLVISDEIYSKMVYDGEYTSFYGIRGMPDRTILVDGHSKTYAMTGWRLGFGVMPEALAAKIGRLMTNANSCTCSFTQLAGVEALQGPQESVRAMVEEFRARRDLIVDGLSRVPGFKCSKPSGAFYVFPNIRGTGMTSKELEAFLMEKAGVAVLAGTSFGALGEGFIRISYANSKENILSALDRMTTALESR